MRSMGAYAAAWWLTDTSRLAAVIPNSPTVPPRPAMPAVVCPCQQKPDRCRDRRAVLNRNDARLDRVGHMRCGQTYCMTGRDGRDRAPGGDHRPHADELAERRDNHKSLPKIRLAPAGEQRASHARAVDGTPSDRTQAAAGTDAQAVTGQSCACSSSIRVQPHHCHACVGP